MCRPFWDMSGKVIAHARLQVSQLTKSQGSLMAEDRRAVLAEQQASMERLVSLISASINRDLPLRMEDLVKAEVNHKSHTKAVPLSHTPLRCPVLFQCHLRPWTVSSDWSQEMALAFVL